MCSRSPSRPPHRTPVALRSRRRPRGPRSPSRARRRDTRKLTRTHRRVRGRGRLPGPAARIRDAGLRHARVVVVSLITSRAATRGFRLAVKGGTAVDGVPNADVRRPLLLSPAGSGASEIARRRARTLLLIVRDIVGLEVQGHAKRCDLGDLILGQEYAILGIAVHHAAKLDW